MQQNNFFLIEKNEKKNNNSIATFGRRKIISKYQDNRHFFVIFLFAWKFRGKKSM